MEKLGEEARRSDSCWQLSSRVQRASHVISARPHHMHTPGAHSRSQAQRSPPCSQSSADLPPTCPAAPSQAPGLPSQSFHSCPPPVAPTAPWALCPAGLALSVSSISGGPVAGAEAGETRIRAGNCRVKMTAQRFIHPKLGLGIPRGCWRQESIPPQRRDY